MQHTLLHFPQITLQRRDGHKLRGYFADLFGQDSDLWHNHEADGRAIYRYPLIQYKVVYGAPMVIGIEAGAQLLIQRFLKIDNLTIDGQSLPVQEKNLKNSIQEIGVKDQLFTYRFVNPWLALNQKNYGNFRMKNEMERKQELERILVSNMIPFFKAVDHFEEKRILLTIQDLEERPVSFKNESMSGFIANFTTNVQLPDYIGLGKSVSRGFGTIELKSGN